MPEQAADSGIRRMRSDAYSSVARILQAARSAFAADGNSTTLQAIADSAKVGIATLYRHFPSRDALATAVFDSVFTDEVQPLLDSFREADTPRTSLLDVAEQLADIMQRERGLVASLNNLTELTAELLHRSDELFGELVARAQQAGNLRPDLISDDVPYLLAMTTTAIGAIELSPIARRRYLSLLLDGLNPARAAELPELDTR